MITFTPEHEKFKFYLQNFKNFKTMTLRSFFEYKQNNNHEQFIVIGGANVFNQCMNQINTFYVTKINCEYACDTYFYYPFETTTWEVNEEDDKNTHKYFTYIRK